MSSQDNDSRKHVVAEVSTIKVAITPLAFQNYAQDFYELVDLSKASEKYSPVLYFLLCRSMELFLKALIINDGISIAREVYLKKLNHNLPKIIKDVEDREILSFSDKEKETVEKANEYYSGKGFEYFTTKMIVESMRGYQGLPDIKKLKKATEKTRSACSKKIK